jgi:hypothetical protein
VSADVKAPDAAKPVVDQSDMLYRAASDAVQKQVQTHPEWDPRYWNAQAPQTRQP